MIPMSPHQAPISNIHKQSYHCQSLSQNPGIKPQIITQLTLKTHGRLQSTVVLGRAIL
jgi:hypothetical protein